MQRGSHTRASSLCIVSTGKQFQYVKIQKGSAMNDKNAEPRWTTALDTPTDPGSDATRDVPAAKRTVSARGHGDGASATLVENQIDAVGAASLALVRGEPAGGRMLTDRRLVTQASMRLWLQRRSDRRC
jgi:hypothetical protein